MNIAAQPLPSAAAPRAPDFDARVLSRAVVRAARLLDLSQREVAAALGISEATASRLFGGRYLLSAERAKEWELALLLVRLFRSLDALWGHGESARAWLASENLALGGRPKDLLRSVEGMVRAVAYLDAARGRV
jgi:transcriptional regulator with XRE-family HTH domain